jgi:alpha-aminoadipic semialdehyde synthase
MIQEKGLPDSIVPLTFGFAGYGNVSRGAQEIIDCLAPESVEPGKLSELVRDGKGSPNKVYKIVFEERHMVDPISEDTEFELQDYYKHPEKYRGKFETYLPELSVLMNCIYWEERYPRLVSKAYLKQARADGEMKLKVIGDIGCDIEGAVQVTVKPTDPGNPVYVYDSDTGKAIDGVAGPAPVILAVDTLPCEIPKESSEYFGVRLEPFIPAIAQADFSLPFEKLELPPEIKRAVIAHKGELTPDFRYISKYLEEFESSVH